MELDDVMKRAQVKTWLIKPMTEVVEKFSFNDGNCSITLHRLSLGYVEINFSWHWSINDNGLISMQRNTKDLISWLD